MIITQITGGLGNQLFQYAAGYAISKKLNTELYLHFYLHESDTKRKAAIAELLTDLNWIGAEVVGTYIPKNTMERLWQRILPFSKKTFYKESHFHFDEQIRYVNDNTYLKGFWQSEKYFLEYADEIKMKLISAVSKIEIAPELLEKINAHPSISVHVRKGDYLKTPYLTYYHQLPNEYYKKGVEQILSTIPNAKIFVFTDDIEWVNQHFDIGYEYEMISGKYSFSVFDDMKAMIACDHHVIANSSFSWWTAWLSTGENKKVVAPAKWFNEGPSDTEDLVPSSWIKV